MAGSSLGSIFIDLKANTADFISGMSAASYAAKKAGKDIEASFSNLGSVAEAALAPFGDVGREIGEIFTKVGDWAGSAAKSFGSMGGSLGVLGAAAGGIAGALAAVDVTAVGLTIHTVETTAKLYELSQQTGISTEALSALSFAAKQTGVDQQALVSSLEILQKNMLTAASAPGGTITAFQRLGISVQNTSGQLNDVGDIFPKIADKLRQLQGTAEQVALARAIFGRGGDELLPLLDQGSTGIEELTKKAQELGIVVSSQTAKSSEEFVTTLNDIKSAAEGAELKLSKELLPTLQTVAKALESAVTTPSSGFSDFISGIGTITKDLVSFGSLVVAVFEQIGKAIGDQLAAEWEAAETLYNVLSNVSHLDFKGAFNSAREGLAGVTAIGSNFLSESKDLWSGWAKFSTSLFLPQAQLPAGPKNPPPKSPPITSSDRNAAQIEKTIQALRTQTQTEVDLAAATTGSTAAQRLQTAAGEAEQAISKLMSDADRATGAERLKLIALVNSETESIFNLTAAKQVAKDAVSLNNELQKETDKYNEQIVSIETMAQAYLDGSEAIARADISAQMVADRQKVADLTEEYALLAAQQPLNFEALAKLAVALAEANAKLEDHDQKLQQIQKDKIDEDINKQSNAIRTQLPYLGALNAAYLQSADAVRAAQIGLQLLNWEQAHPGATPDQIAAAAAQYKALSDQSYAASLAEQAGQYIVGKSYNDRITQLEQIRDLITSNNKINNSTLLIDAAIYDVQTKNLQQWDEAALKVGTYHDKLQSLFNEISISAQDTGGKIFQAIGTAIDDVSTKFAEFVVTGKNDFKDLLTTLGESIVKANTQDLIGKAAGGLSSLLHFSIPGLGPKHDGSTADTFLYTKSVDNAGNDLAANINKAMSGSLGSFNSDFGKTLNTFGHGLDETFTGFGNGLISIFSSFESSLSSGGKSGGGLLGSLIGAIGGIFGGGGDVLGDAGGPILSDPFGGGGITFAAGGADLTAGQAAIIGEEGPELFVPKSAGSVIPNGQFGGSTTINYNIDAKGAQPGVERDIVRALKATEDRAVARAIATQQQLGLRSPSTS